MYEGRTVAVIIPAYNEQAHVAEVIASVPPFVDRIYAIDDASTDATWDEIQSTAAAYNSRGTDDSPAEFGRIVPIRHEQNRGAGAAVITGYEHAIADGIDLTAVMDGDGQMDPSHLHRLIEPVATGEVGYAKGNRLQRRNDRATMSRWRLFGNGLLTMLTRIASGYWAMSDPQNGYTVISREALTALPLDQLYERYGFLNDMLVQLNYNREQIVDVAHPSVYGDEVSGIRYREFVPGLSRLLAKRFVQRITRMYLLRTFHPVSICYPIGVAAFLVGILATGMGLLGVGGLSGISVGLATIVTMFGLLFLVLGLAFDVHMNADLVDHIARPERDRSHLYEQADMGVSLASDGGDTDQHTHYGETE